MSNIAIKVKNLAKAYQIGEFSTGTISQDIERWWLTKIRGKEDPFLKIGETNDRSKKGHSNIVWSLKDLSFEVKKGEAIGIIGKNGAGKSTLLKLLSRVTAPSLGSIKVKGRIASLLEVGTGFHPELTGRENIYLNGAILGMRNHEITRKLDEIIDFSGVERYIDTPVKRYSSGMYVRLAFAVAAHLESEILIVDEVLAVGDADFQKKCLGKMGEVSKGEGRTVLFVSHNMNSVKALCNQGILLENGQIAYHGSVNETLNRYLASKQDLDVGITYKKKILDDKPVQVIRADIKDAQGKGKSEFEISEDIFISITLDSKEEMPGIYGYIVIMNMLEEILIESDTFDYMPNCLENLKHGENKFQIKISRNTLAIGEYHLYLALSSPRVDASKFDRPGEILKFSLIDSTTKRGGLRSSKTSHLLKWEPIG
jgi:lipopolysaccharide transport system ATP-binding protein